MNIIIKIGFFNDFARSRRNSIRPLPLIVFTPLRVFDFYLFFLMFFFVRFCCFACCFLLKIFDAHQTLTHKQTRTTNEYKVFTIQNNEKNKSSLFNRAQDYYDFCYTQSSCLFAG